MRDVAFYSVVCAFLLGVTLGVLHAGAAASQPPSIFRSLIGNKATLQGVIVSAPDERETSTRITIETEREGVSTRILVVGPRHIPLEVGDEVTVYGTPERAEPFDTDGGRTFAYDRFLAKDGITLIMQRGSVEVTGVSDSIWLRFSRGLGNLRSWFMHSLEAAIPEPQSALAAGIIVGGKQGLGKELLEAFTIAGMLQLVVLSGYNVAVIVDGILRVLSKLPKRTAATIAVVAIACFVLAAGAGSSALRAGLMAIIALVVRTVGREYLAIRVLFLTLAVLAVWNPLFIVYDPGLQFSFLATLGLLLGTPILERWFWRIKSAMLRELLASSLAAQAGVLPMLLWQTGNLSLVSVPANILASVAIPLAMALSAIAAVTALPFGVVSPVLPLVVGTPANVVLGYIITIATVSASLPLAMVVLPSFPFWIVVLAYAALAGLVWRFRTNNAESPQPERLRGLGAAGY